MAGYIGGGTSTTLTSVSGNEIGADELNVEGNGTVGQALTSDGDGSMTWAALAADSISEGDSSVEVVDTGSGYITATTDGTERMRIDSSGNVGIGTSSPTSPLHVYGGHNGLSSIIVDDTGVGGGRKWGIRPGLPGVNNGYLTIHDETANATRLVVDDSGNFRFNSGYGSAATAYGCRAWVNIAGGFSNTFNRIGSGNVSSVTDNGSGDYTLHFATSMPDTNYAVVGATCGNSNNGNPFTFELPPHYNDGVDGQATGSVRVYAVLTGANAKQDVNKCHVAVFR